MKISSGLTLCVERNLFISSKKEITPSRKFFSFVLTGGKYRNVFI